MNQFKNILYVTENKVDQTSAVARAVSLAENNQAKLTIMDVIPPVVEDYRTETITVHRNALESLIEPYRHRMKIQLDVLIGTTFLEVIRAVLKNGHDLVIKAAEDPGFIKRLFGSDDMHLLRKCPCPVWLMKPPEKSNYNCILAAVDFDPLKPSSPEKDLNREILELASSLALSDFAALHLAHAWEALAETTLLSKRGISSEGIDAYIEKERLLHEKSLSTLAETLRDWIGNDAYDYLSPRLHLPKGSAKRMIPVLAAELQADLVVMGTIARTGVSGLIIGNTAEAILNQLSCSVLAIKPPGFSTPVKLAG
jgi:universal stress protein E